MIDFDAANYFTAATGFSGNIDYSFESSNTSVAEVDEGTLLAYAEGSATITVTATPNPAVSGYKAASGEFTVTVSDNRVAVATISAISPTAIYVGQEGTFTATLTDKNEANPSVSFSSSDDDGLLIIDNDFVASAAGNYTVTATATPSSSAYKTASEEFPVTVSYKYTAPTLTAAGIFMSSKTIEISAVDGADVYYATDGTAPTKSSTKYTEAFEVNATTTVKAIAIDANGLVSPVAEATYTKENVLDINGTEVTFSDFSGAGGGYNDGAEKNLTFTATDGVTTLSITGTNIMSNSGLQVRNTPGTFTTQYVKNGTMPLSLTATFTNGLTYSITYADGTAATNGTLTSNEPIIPESYPCKFTFTRSSGTPVISKIVLTPLKYAIATDVTITDPGTLAKGATGTFDAISTDAATCTKTWASSNDAVIEITNAETGAFEAKGRGTATITLTITPEDNSTYREVVAERTISVTEPVVVTVNDIAMTYGDDAKALGATTSTGYAGTLTYTSGNTDIATIDASGNVTALAVGTTTITVSAPADAANLYAAGEDKVISVTINEPASYTVEKEILLEEHFTSMSSTNGNNITTANCDYKGWTNINKVIGASGFVWIASSSYAGSISTGTLSNLHAGATISLRAYGNKEGNILTLTPTDCTLDETTITTTTSWATYTVNVTAVSGTPSIEFSAASGKQVNIDDIVISQSVATIPATIAANKEWVTFCSPYVLDFSEDVAGLEGAYYVSAHESEATALTVTKVTGKVPAKTGLLLHVTPAAESQVVDIPVGDTGETLTTNMLVGVLSPTYIEPTTGIFTNLGLSNGNFYRYANAGVLQAGKAYLQVPTSDMPSEDDDAKFILVFDETTDVTGIEKMRNVENEKCYNLAGQRVGKNYKGLVIVNGRKYMNK